MVTFLPGYLLAATQIAAMLVVVMLGILYHLLPYLTLEEIPAHILPNSLVCGF